MRICVAHVAVRSLDAFEAAELIVGNAKVAELSGVLDKTCKSDERKALRKRGVSAEDEV